MCACLSVGHNLSPPKNGGTDRDVIWAFGTWTRGRGPKKPREGAFFSPFGKSNTWTCPDMPAVDILNFIREGTAAMRFLATSTVAT